MDTRSQEIKQLAQHFAEGPAIFTTSPLYQSFCKVVAQDQPVLELLTQRQTGQQASFLLFGAIHYLLLSGAQHPLRDFYPSLVDRVTASPGEAGPELLDFCHTYRNELETLIRTRLVQTNVVKRSVGLLVALRAVRMRGVERVHLIEVGTSAGIHLHVDRYRYLIGGLVFGQQDSKVVVETQWRGKQPPDFDARPQIVGRLGIDLHPVDAANPEERLWLRALVWPENQHEADQLSAALESIASAPPTIIAGDAIDVCPALGKQLPPGEARIVFHAATRMHVPINRRAAFDAAIDTLGEDGPLYHIWHEPASAPHAGMPSDPRGVLALHGPGDDQPVSLAQVSGHLDWIELLDD
ncbi:MAG TPA: DUF2332 domain-containing protein [Ktedonosporobacter sp.]|jgi:hypothetical protein|nr:DUF2332 domain-containing protein [Ktedonosporobacter sp.]